LNKIWKLFSAKNQNWQYKYEYFSKKNPQICPQNVKFSLFVFLVGYYTFFMVFYANLVGSFNMTLLLCHIETLAGRGRQGSAFRDGPVMQYAECVVHDKTNLY